MFDLKLIELPSAKELSSKVVSQRETTSFAPRGTSGNYNSDRSLEDDVENIVTNPNIVLTKFPTSACFYALIPGIQERHVQIISHNLIYSGNYNLE